MRTEIKPGTRYTKNGVSIDVHDVKDGEVYVRRWPKGVESQSFFQNMLKAPIADFLLQIEGATIETGITPLTHQTSRKAVK